MNSRLTSIIKWGCIVYSIIFLPRFFVSVTSADELQTQQKLRVGIVSEDDTLSLQQQSILCELDKQGYVVDKLLVLDRVPEHERCGHKQENSIQLEQLLCEADLDDIDVVICEDEHVRTFKHDNRATTWVGA